MSRLETINIPGTRLQPTRVALGTWAIGGWMWGGSDDADSIRTIHSAIDRGINIIDTAPVYGFGHSEEIVGRALAEGGRRQRTIIATKVALEWKDGKVFRNASKARIEKEIEDSLRRLQTDVIDIYQVHWPDDATPIAETAETLGKLFKAGKIRAIGVSNFNVAQMEAFRAVAPLHTIQPPHNLFERGAESRHRHGARSLCQEQLWQNGPRSRHSLGAGPSAAEHRALGRAQARPARPDFARFGLEARRRSVDRDR
jgi:aryl-alcohol dehydrogenase-like predicted oxidoreductase